MERLIEKISKTLEATGETYKKVFKYYYPAHDGNGFTERNQTFNFSHNYLTNNYDAIVWQELPVRCEVKEGHIDTLIIDNELKVILFIEAKRISKSQVSRKFSSIKEDMKRLCANNFVKSIPQGLLINEYQHYILYLADTWYNDNESADELDTRKGVLSSWTEKSNFNEWISIPNIIEIACGVYQIGKPSDHKTAGNYVKINDEKYNLMYRLYSVK